MEVTKGKILNLEVRLYLRRLQAAGEPLWWYKVQGSKFRRAGIPHLCIVYHGQPVFLELSAPGDKLALLQEQTLHDIQAAGGCSRVVRCLDDVRAILEFAKAKALTINGALNTMQKIHAAAQQAAQVQTANDVTELRIADLPYEQPGQQENSGNSVESELTAGTHL